MASIFHISEILKNPYFILHDVFIACGRDTADNAVVGELHGDLSLTARMLIDGGVDDTALHGTPDGGDDVEGDDGDVVRAFSFDKRLADAVCTAGGSDKEGVHRGMRVEHLKGFLVGMDVIVGVLHDGGILCRLRRFRQGGIG